MTSVQQSHHMMTSHSSSATGHNLDNNLDALLDDLQTSVRPSNQAAPLLNGFSGVALPPGASGYREITTTVTQETNGVPTTSREYQIEYLNPANSVTVMDERTTSPGGEVIKHTETSGAHSASYKESYGSYKQTFSDSREERSRAVGSYSSNALADARMPELSLNRNLNELDVLLKELNAPNPPRREMGGSLERSPARGYDIGGRSSSTSREHREYYTDTAHSTGYRADSPAPPAPPALPGTPKAPQRTVNVQRDINTIETRGHVSRRDSPSNRDKSVEMSPTLRRRTPSPSSEFRPAHFSTYPISPHETRTVVTKQTYTSHNTHPRRTPTPTDDSIPYRSPSPVSFPQRPQRSPSPVRKTGGQGGVVRSDSGRALNYQGGTYRSPSPVSFAHKPEKRSPTPERKAVSRSDSGRTLTYQVSPTPPPPTLSDPSSPTVITYKYSSHSSQHSRYPGTQTGYPDEREPLMPRPFPTASPIQSPGEQSPPKKLDDLMASFQQQDKRVYNEYYQSREREIQLERERLERESRERQAVDLQRSPSFERNLRPSNVKASQHYSSHQVATREVNEVIPPPSPPPQTQRAPPPSKSVAGPPVYYPPGVELFQKKEEAYMQQEAAGGKGEMRAKGKMKYKYEKSEKSKEKSSSGVTAVPVCLPVCCAMPCSIM